MKNQFLPARPASERLGPLQHNAHAPTMGSPVRRLSCKNTPDQPGNRANTNSTISPVCYLTPMPLPLPIFTTPIPSGPPARALVRQR